MDIDYILIDETIMRVGVVGWHFRFWIFHFVCSGCWLHHCCECGCAANVVPPVLSRRNLEFGQRASDSWPHLRERLHGIFNVHQLTLWERMPSWTFIWTDGTYSTFIPFPICQTPRWQFIAALLFKPKWDNSGSVCLPQVHPSSTHGVNKLTAKPWIDWIRYRVKKKICILFLC